jgi:LacI family transcriptional regulator
LTAIEFNTYQNIRAQREICAKFIKKSAEHRISAQRVALACPGSVPWITHGLDGIRAYARDQGGWRIDTSPPTLGSIGEWEISLRSLRDWNGDAILTVSSKQEELAFARELRIPAVNLGGGPAESHGIPRVMVDCVQAGRLATEHLLERGLPHLAFFGWTNLWYSQKRQQEFRAGMRARMIGQTQRS